MHKLKNEMKQYKVDYKLRAALRALPDHLNSLGIYEVHYKCFTIFYDG